MAIDFNATTSKISRATGALDSAAMTILAWAWGDGLGESSLGRLFKIGNDSLNSYAIFYSAANTLTFVAEWSGTDGQWVFTANTGQWNAIAVTYTGAATTTDPVIRVNFAAASGFSEAATPTGTRTVNADGYVVGNRADDARTWDGGIQHVMVYHRVLSAAECDAALRRPGSIRNSLKLWLPMYHATYLNDLSGSGFHGTGANLANRPRKAPVLPWGVGRDGEIHTAAGAAPSQAPRSMHQYRMRRAA